MESLVGSASTVSPWHYFHDGNVQQEKLINRIIDDDEQSLSTSSGICHLCNSYSTIFDGLTGEFMLRLPRASFKFITSPS